MNKSSLIYIAGHQGMVGSAILRCLQAEGFNHLLYLGRDQLDLTVQQAVNDFFQHNRPEYVFLSAARVGGINANNRYRGEFLYQNLMIQNNVIHAAWKYEVKRLLFLGSSCVYPRDCPQPMQESYLLTAPLEFTNEPYAVAKIAGIKLCENYNTQYGTSFVPVMPTNLYGPNDNFDLQSSHVLPALIRKVHEARQAVAKTVEVWGSGSPLREFLHVDDLANACVFVMQNPEITEMLNIGSGEEVNIRQLATEICQIVGYRGGLEFNNKKPDGTPRKLLDSSKIHKLGWQHRIPLQKGLKSTYRWYRQNAE